MASKRDSIGEDWEDVGDDNLSVVSLPTSDDDERPTAQTTASSLKDSIVAGESVSETSTLQCNHHSTSNYKNKGKEVTSTEDLSADHLMKRPINTAEDPFRDPSVSECLNFDPAASQEDLVDSNGAEEVNHHDLLRDLDSLHKVLNDTIQSVKDLSTLHSDTAEKTLKFCQHLSIHVDELRAIKAGYARVGRGTSTDISLDPGLFAWLSGVRLKALALQVELQDEVKRTLQAGHSQRSTNIVLRDIWTDLEKWSRQMHEFLPIMQADYNDYQTRQMHIPTARVEPLNFTNHGTRSAPIDIPQTTTGKYYYHPPMPNTRVSHIRTSVYRLRDEIKRAAKTLGKTSPCLRGSAAKTARQMSPRYMRLFETVSTSLSNHGSEWIESGLSGGLSYAEFAQLDVPDMQEYASELEQTVDKLESWRRAMSGMGPKCTVNTLTAARRDHDGDVVMHDPDRDVILEQLELLLQVLWAEFRVKME